MSRPAVVNRTPRRRRAIGPSAVLEASSLRAPSLTWHMCSASHSVDQIFKALSHELRRRKDQTITLSLLAEAFGVDLNGLTDLEHSVFCFAARNALASNGFKRVR